MIYLIDKRTDFYYTVHKEAFIGENKGDIPENIRNSPFIQPEEFDDERETELFTEMFNCGIDTVRVGQRPFRIEIEDIEYLSPNYIEMYLSHLKLGRSEYKRLLWDEKAYFIVKLDTEPEFLITNIDNEIYYVVFASKVAADDFLRGNQAKYENFTTALYPLDPDMKYCLLGCNTTVLLDKKRINR